MKIKFSWIPFIPVAILSVVLRVYQLLFIQRGVDTSFLTSDVIWLVYAGLVALLFIISGILCIADKQTAPVYKPKVNVLSGLFGVFSAIALIYNAGYSIGSFAGGSSALSVSVLVDAVFGFLGGIAIFFMGLSSLTGKNIAKKLGVFSVVAPLWCCVKMVTTFVDYTKQSVRSADMTNLFFIAFMTLAMFNLSMIYQQIHTKNAVKGTILYGMPAFVVTIVYATADAITQVTETGNYDYLSSIDTITFVLLAFYVLFMMFELTINAKTKDEIQTEAEVKKSAEASKKIKAVAVDDVVSREIDNVDNVVNAVEDDEADNYSPDTLEYYNRQSSNIGYDDMDESLNNINKLIDEINAGE